MRVWGLADPRYLNRHHLLAEHREIHVLGKRRNGPGPEFDRFWKTKQGRSALILRHELVRVAMNVRWLGKHKRGVHKTPVKHWLMLPRHKRVLYLYAKACHDEMDSWLLVPETNNQRFSIWMHGISFPATELEGYADTPWRRDGITLLEYLAIGDKWRRSMYHHKRSRK